MYWSSELNSPFPVYFSSPIPKMLMFTFAISCLTTYSLPWFMDLTFQVPVQYCSLQHWTLFPPTVTPTTGHCFYLGSISSCLFLELFLHTSPVAHGAPTDLGSSSFSVISSYLFITVHGVLNARIRNGLPFPSPVLQSMGSQRMEMSDWTELWRGGAMGRT